MRSTTTYYAENGKVYAKTPEGVREVATALSTNGRDLARFEKALDLAKLQKKASEPDLGWARTGAINSRAHIAVVEPWQNLALCGAGITLAGEIRPKPQEWCPRCARLARKRGVDPNEIGIENDLR